MSEFSRTETIVLHFTSQEAWRNFFETYSKNKIEGIHAKSFSTGDRVKRLDECQELMYRAAEKLHGDADILDELYDKAQE